MSYDRQIDQTCQHRVVEEALYVDADRQTIRPIRPIASMDSVIVRVNGAITVPSQGHYAPGRVVGSRDDTFTVTAGSNDKLLLQVGVADVQTLTLPAGTYLTAKQIAYILNQQARGVLFESHGRRLAVRTVDEGAGATMVLKTGSTFAATAGLGVNRVWRGRTINPGWSLINDPNTLNDRPTRWIVFDEPLKSTTDFAEITYTTVREECRRCGGLGVEHDWRYTITGDVVEVRDEALLLQEILKIMYTILGSNPFNLWYGTDLVNMVGSKIILAEIVQNTIVTNVQTAFNRWQSIKRRQEQDVGQEVSDREYPYRLVSVSAQQSSQDQTVFWVFITVQNRSGNPIDMTRGIRIPQPLSLMDSTAAQGVMRQSLSNYVLTG
jgi:phage baseplate assembly protein W